MKKIWSDEMLMLFVWEGINEALGFDTSEPLKPEAVKIYNCILNKFIKKHVVEGGNDKTD